MDEASFFDAKKRFLDEEEMTDLVPERVRPEAGLFPSRGGPVPSEQSEAGPSRYGPHIPQRARAAVPPPRLGLMLTPYHVPC